MKLNSFIRHSEMIGGIGNVLLSRPDLKLEIGKIQRLLSVNLWGT